MNKPAAIYARVSSDRQKENHTIASQTAALIEYAQKNGYSVPPEWVFQDEGYSGATLLRPGLEAVRDLAAAGQIFGQVLQIERENVKAIAGMAKAQIKSGDLDGAKATLALVPPQKTSDPEIASVRAMIELSAKQSDPAAIRKLATAVEQNPADHQSRYDLAVALNGIGRRQEALDHLLTIISRDRGWNDEAARKQLVQFFDAWGPKDELTQMGRRRLSSILFS